MSLKPVYLVHGDDDARIDDWRIRLRRRAEEEHGPGGLESFDARESGPGAVAAELMALTFMEGTRYFIVDDASVWKAGDLDPLLQALSPPPPATVVLLLVRGKPLKGLLTVTEAAGGEVKHYEAPKKRELPRWLLNRAEGIPVDLDRDAASLLVDVVGQSRHRLASELDKLVLAVYPETRITAEDVEALSRGDTAPQVWALADAVVAGNRVRALSLAEELTAAGEAPERLLYPIGSRVRETMKVARMLEAGVPEKEVAASLGGPPWKARNAVQAARGADVAVLERAAATFAKLEVDLRGGLPWRRSGLGKDEVLTLAIASATA